MKSMKQQTTIYSLKDPRNNQIRYIGETTELIGKRLHNHVNNCHKYSNRNAKWILELRNMNLKPIIEEIDIVEFSDKKDRNNQELFYIRMFRYWGFDLLNKHEKIITIKKRKKFSFSKDGRLKHQLSQQRKKGIKYKMNKKNKNIEKFKNIYKLYDCEKTMNIMGFKDKRRYKTYFKLVTQETAKSDI